MMCNTIVIFNTIIDAYITFVPFDLSSQYIELPNIAQEMIFFINTAINNHFIAKPHCRVVSSRPNFGLQNLSEFLSNSSLDVVHSNIIVDLSDIEMFVVVLLTSKNNDIFLLIHTRRMSIPTHLRLVSFLRHHFSFSVNIIQFLHIIYAIFTKSSIHIQLRIN